MKLGGTAITNPVLECIKSRRSIRVFQDKAVPADALDAVLEAGAWAASGMNLQGWKITAIQSPDRIALLDQAIRDCFLAMENPEPMMGKMVEKAKQGGQFVFDCPVYIIVSYDKDARNALADSSLALGNMMLAAHSLDLGTCWHNAPAMMRETPVITSYGKAIGLPENHRIFGTLALGWPGEAPAAPPRKDGIVQKL